MDIPNRYDKHGNRVPYLKRDVINYVCDEFDIEPHCIEFITARMIKITVGDQTIWRLWDTDIVIWDRYAGIVHLDSGGWKGPFTKQMMNTIFRENFLNLGVFQKAHQWYVTTKRGDLDFEDDMSIHLQEGVAV